MFYGSRLKKNLVLCFALAALFANLTANSAQAREKTRPCSEVTVIGPKKIEFTDTEKRLLCGDKKLEAWKKIPAYQARYFMIGFLQSRGYLNPKFAIENERLLVDTGETVKVEELLVKPERLIESDKIENEIWRYYDGRTVTPQLLDAMEKDALGLLRENAYACAQVEAMINANNGVAAITAQNLGRYKFGKVAKEDVPGLNEDAFERFYPFSPEDAFNSELLELTEKRLLRSGVAQASYFLEDCSTAPDNFSLKHNFILGPRRTFRFGVGVSSQVGPIFRVRWTNNRSGEMASQLGADLQTSLVNQSLTLTAENFLWPSSPRQSLASQFQAAREKQIDYEETTVSLRSHPRWSRDFRGRFWQLSAGPALMNSVYKTDRASGSRSFSGMALEGGLVSMGHDYEIYDINPQEGSLFKFNFDLRPQGLGFSEELLKLDIGHTSFFRLWKWGRGDAVGGVRIGAHSTVVDSEVSLNSLPPSVKFYGGGSDDIRGFALRELPENNGLGALSKLLTKLELRKTHLGTPSLEGFIFYDAAYFGPRPWTFDPSLFQSPGVGARWVSPIGLVQAFIAKGYTAKPYEDYGFLYYAGLGGEF